MTSEQKYCCGELDDFRAGSRRYVTTGCMILGDNDLEADRSGCMGPKWLHSEALCASPISLTSE